MFNRGMSKYTQPPQTQRNFRINSPVKNNNHRRDKNNGASTEGADGCLGSPLSWFGINLGTPNNSNAESNNNKSNSPSSSKRKEPVAWMGRMNGNGEEFFASPHVSNNRSTSRRSSKHADAHIHESLQSNAMTNTTTHEDEYYNSDEFDDNEDDEIYTKGVFPMNGNKTRKNGVISRTHPRSNSRQQQRINSNAVTLSPIQMHSPLNGNISLDHFVESPNADAANESRIVAPHVGKLAPSSVVEIRLQSLQEVVAVLCSVDVLKMRSGFFGEILDVQEKEIPLDRSSWREPVTIPEVSPFEAAAFLESLHEGRTLFNEEWNFTWCRLSVHWLVEELVVEFAYQIESHINRLISRVNATSWRTNCDVFAGMSIAVFHKKPSSTPTVLMGTAIESSGGNGSLVPYSRLRVEFDANSSVTASGGGCFTGNINSNNNNSVNKKHRETVGTCTSTDYGNHADDSDIMSGAPTILSTANVHIGDVTEPFWVRKSDVSSWMEPDEMSMVELKKVLTSSDKRLFWEMVRSILDLPVLASKLKCPIKNSKDLYHVMSKPENRILWTSGSCEYLPKDTACALVGDAYGPHDDNVPVTDH